MKNIILTGFMGTGKSSVGRRLAKQLNLKFADTDDLIEKEAGQRVADIFTEFGEEFFRKLEAKVIQEISSRSDTVIATGGGAIVNPANFEALKKNGIIITLSASVHTILSRVGKADERPLLAQGDKREAIETLLKIREPYYKKTDLVIDTTDKSISIVVEDIKKFLKSVNRKK